MNKRVELEKALEQFMAPHHCKDAADAVLAVLRKPNEGMFEAGRRVSAQPLHNVSSIWTAMIDAAISEGMVRVEEER